MTKFSVQPYKTVTARSYMRYDSAEDFARALTVAFAKGSSGRIGHLWWANGIVFRHFPFAPSDALSKQYLLGNFMIDHIEFAPMPQYKNEIRVEEFIVTVGDVTNHIFFNDFTKWIKTNLAKK